MRFINEGRKHRLGEGRDRSQNRRKDGKSASENEKWEIKWKVIFESYLVKIQLWKWNQLQKMGNQMKNYIFLKITFQLLKSNEKWKVIPERFLKVTRWKSNFRNEISFRKWKIKWKVMYFWKLPSNLWNKVNQVRIYRRCRHPLVFINHNRMFNSSISSIYSCERKQWGERKLRYNQEH